MKLLFHAFLLVFSIPSIAQTDKPNIIYIMVDDMGYGDLSGYGRKEYKTPNLDKLASDGIKFTNAYAAGSLCTPTRTAFMTGRYPAKTSVGLFEPLRGTPKDSMIGLSPSDNPLPLLLKKYGYTTALIGKWHLGFLPEFSPNKNGYEEFFGFHPGATDYISHANRRGVPMLYHNETRVKQDGYFTDIIGDKTVEYINQKHTKPFFLSIQFNAPHWPWQARGDAAYPDTIWTSGGAPEIFARMMTALDEAVGKILSAVDDAGLSRNTVVIFTSDNGGEKFSDMGGLRGKKLDFFEGGIRVPAFVRWPGKITPNTKTDQVAITMDWTSTILSIAGAKEELKGLDGIDLVPILTGKTKTSDRTLFWRMAQTRQQKAVRDGQWKYVSDDKGEYLFNLHADPSEKTDSKSANNEIFQKLKNKYASWEATLLTPIPL